MDVSTLTALGRDLQHRLRTFFDAPPEPGAPPLEIAQAALDDIERHVVPASSGRRIFPFTRVTVRVRAPGEAWPAIEAVLADLPERMRARLSELRCEAPRGLEARVACEAPGDAGPGFTVEYERSAAPAGGVVPALTATVVRGAAAEVSWTFTDGTVAIGRDTEAIDDEGRVRRNHLAFLDVHDGVTETVGRAHARLRFDADLGAYRVYDDGSRNGTTVLRAGEAIAVPRRDPRGVRLRSGDELQLGRALVHIVVER